MDHQQEQLVKFLNRYFSLFGICIFINAEAPSIAFRDLIVHDQTRSIFRELLWQYLATSRRRKTDGIFCTYDDNKMEYELGRFKPDPTFVFALFKEYLLPIDFFEDTPRMKLGRDPNLNVIFNHLRQEEKTPTLSTQSMEYVSVWNACLNAARGKDVTDEIEAKAVVKMYSKEEEEKMPHSFFVTGKQLELALRLYKQKPTIWTGQPRIQPYNNTSQKRRGCKKLVFYPDGKFPLMYHRHVQYSSEYKVANTKQLYEIQWRKPKNLNILRCLYRHRYKKELGTAFDSKGTNNEDICKFRSRRSKLPRCVVSEDVLKTSDHPLSYLLNRVTFPPRASLEQQQCAQLKQSKHQTKKTCLEELKERGFRSTVREGNIVVVMKAAVGHVNGFVLGKKKRVKNRTSWNLPSNRSNSTFIKSSYKFLGAVGNVYMQAPNAGRSLNMNINFNGSIANFICGSTRIANAFLRGRKYIIYKPVYISNVASINQSKLAVLRNDGETTTTTTTTNSSSSQSALKMLRFPALENFYFDGHSIEFPTNVNIYKHKGQTLKQIIEKMNTNFNTNPLIDRTLMRWKADLDESRQEISEKDVNVLLLIARLVMGAKTNDPIDFLTSRCLLSRSLVAGSVTMNQSSYDWRKGAMKTTKAENKKQKGALIQCPGINIVEQTLRATGHKSLADKLANKTLEALKQRSIH